MEWTILIWYDTFTLKSKNIYNIKSGCLTYKGLVFVEAVAYMAWNLRSQSVMYNESIVVPMANLRMLWKRFID